MSRSSSKMSVIEKREEEPRPDDEARLQRVAPLGPDKETHDEQGESLAQPTDRRSGAVWRQWLSSMATDAEAALAAAIAYRDLDSAGRESWLCSLKLDAPRVEVPAIALYAPLVAVEDDPDRRHRLITAMAEESEPEAVPREAQALIGKCNEGTRIYVLAIPLYLEFVQVLACGVLDGQFKWVRHDPIAFAGNILRSGDRFEGALLETAPVKSVIDDLASTVLSHRRSGRELPDALSVLGDILGDVGP